MNKGAQLKESTDDLMRLLSASGDIDKYFEAIQGYSKTPEISGYILLIIEQKDLKKARVIEKAGIDRVYGYEIFRGKKIPGRDTLIRILLTMQVNVQNIQNILKNTGYPILYPKNMRDAIIIFGIQNLLGIDRLNILLDDFGQKII